METKKSKNSASSDSEVRKNLAMLRSYDVDQTQSEKSSPEPAPKPAKKEKGKKSTPQTANEDVPMRDTSPSPPPLPAPAVIPKSKIDEAFDSIYIRRITTELADDLDKVREAQDFKANSIPMLVHALKQGEGLFSTEEKRRVVASVKA